MAGVPLGEVSWERMIGAVEKVRDRLLRAARLLDQHGIPYAVIGGHAVAAHVSKVDEAAVRNTQDVDILLRRTDLERAKEALEGGGFVYRYGAGIHMFLDGPQAKARDAVHIALAGEKVRAEYVQPAPDVTESESTEGGFRVLRLESLVGMKLTAFRDKDRTHLRDMIELGLIDQSWKEKLIAPLAQRLQQLLDTPDG